VIEHVIHDRTNRPIQSVESQDVQPHGLTDSKNETLTVRNSWVGIQFE